MGRNWHGLNRPNKSFVSKLANLKFFGFKKTCQPLTRPPVIVVSMMEQPSSKRSRSEATTQPGRLDMWKRMVLKVMFLLRATSQLVLELLIKKENPEEIEEFEMISQLSYQSLRPQGIWKEPQEAKIPSSPSGSSSNSKATYQPQEKPSGRQTHPATTVGELLQDPLLNPQTRTELTSPVGRCAVFI